MKQENRKDAENAENFFLEILEKDKREEKENNKKEEESLQEYAENGLIEELLRLRQENEMLREKEEKRIFDSDLKLIKNLDPMVKSIEDLGELFIALRAEGIGARDAYEAVASLKEKKQIPQMGDVAYPRGEKDYLTPEDVRNMSKSDIKKNYEKIRKSMKCWKA